MTNRNDSETDTGGRPTSYDVSLVHKIVSEGLATGIPASNLDANYVLKELSSKHGVSPKIRKESLQGHVDAAHEEIQEATNKALLKALPHEIAAAVDEAVAAVGREFLLMVARQHVASMAIADQACEELRTDKRNAKHRIMHLEDDLVTEKEASRTLEWERNAIAGQLAEVQENLRIVEADMERFNREPSGFDRLLEELRNPAIREDIRAALSDIIANPSEPPPE